MSIQKIMLIIAVILLIIALIVIGVSLRNKKYTDKYPPVVANCPDYWEDKSEGNESDGSKCVNVKNLGKESCEKEMDFSKAEWKGISGLCNKKRWAKICNITWDGVSNSSEKC